MSEGYLPPVVVTVTGDITDLLAKIKDAQAALAAFAKGSYQAKLSVEYSQVTNGVAAAKALCEGFAKTYTAELKVDGPSAANVKVVTTAVTKVAKDAEKVATVPVTIKGPTDKQMYSVNQSMSKFVAELDKEAQIRAGLAGPSEAQLNAVKGLLANVWKGESIPLSVSRPTDAQLTKVRGLIEGVWKANPIDMPVKPQLLEFTAAEEKKFEDGYRAWKPKIAVELGMPPPPTAAQMKKFNDALAASKEKAKLLVELDASNAGLATSLAGLMSKLKEIKVPVQPDTANFMGTLALKLAALKKIPDVDISAKLKDLLIPTKGLDVSFGKGVDTKAAMKSVTDFMDWVGKRPAADVPVDVKGIAADQAKVTALTTWINKQSATLPIKLEEEGGGGAAGKGFLWNLLMGAGSKGGAFGIPALTLGVGAGALAKLPFEIAGLTVTHAAIEGMTLAATATMALAGLAVKAGAAAAVTLVGAGSTALVGSSTMADVKQIMQAQQAIQTAIASGQSASTIKNLQNQYNALLSNLRGGMPASKTPGVTAEIGFANALSALNTYWDQATQSGRKAAVNFYSQWLQVAEGKPGKPGTGYIPLINNAAVQNFRILTQAIQPFITWLDSMGTVKDPGGKRIFGDLEKQYAKDLPELVNTFTQGFEALMKTIDWVVTKKTFMTGLKHLEDFFTALNESISGQPVTGKYKDTNVKQTVGNMLADWNSVWTLLKTVGDTIYHAFSQGKDPHIGRSIIDQITEIFQGINSWEQTTAGAKTLKSLFDAHKSLATSVINLVATILGGLAKLFLALAPSAASTAASVISGITSVIKEIFTLIGGVLGLIGKIPGTKDIGKVVGTGFGLAATVPLLLTVLGKIPLIGTLFSTLSTGIGDLLTSAGTKKGGVVGKGLSWLGSLFGTTGGKGSPQVVFSAAVDKFALSVDEMTGKGALNWPTTGAGSKGSKLGGLTSVLGLAGLALAASSVGQSIANGFIDAISGKGKKGAKVKSFLDIMLTDVPGFGGPALLNFLEGKDIADLPKNAAKWTTDIKNAFSGKNSLASFFVSVGNGIKGALEGAFKGKNSITSFFLGVAGDIESAFVGKHSISAFFTGIGADIGNALKGAFTGKNSITSFFTGAAGDVKGAFTGKGSVSSYFSGMVGDIGTALNPLGKDFLKWASGWLKDITDTMGGVTTWFSNMPTNVGTALRTMGSSFLKWAGGWAGQVKAAFTGHGGLVGWFTNLPGDIGHSLGAMGASFLRWATGWVGQVENAFTGKGGLTEWFIGLPHAIGVSLRNAATLFTQWGKGWASDLVNAFTNIGGAIWNAIKSSFKTVRGIPSAVLHFFGLQHGGLVTEPTLAVVGEAGPEWVIPQALINQYKGRVAPLPPTLTHPGTGGASSSNVGVAAATNITVNFTGTPMQLFQPGSTFKAALDKYMNQRDAQLVHSLRAGTITR